MLRFLKLLNLRLPSHQRFEDRCHVRDLCGPKTGADYPAGWSIRLPGEKLTINLKPTVPAQELDTRATTGVVYWEGSQVVTARRDGGPPMGGEAYVELTGYGTTVADGAAPASGARPAADTIPAALASSFGSVAIKAAIRVPEAR